jgi:hypothetical protein
MNKLLVYMTLASAMLGTVTTYAAQPLRCTVTLLQPFPIGTDGLYVPPEESVVVFDLKSNQEKTIYLAVKQAVPPPQMVQYTAVEVSKESEATFIADFSKTDSNNGHKLPDGNYAVTFGPKANPSWMIATGTFSMANPVSLEPNDGKGLAILTCHPR